MVWIQTTYNGSVSYDFQPLKEAKNRVYLSSPEKDSLFPDRITLAVLSQDSGVTVWLDREGAEKLHRSLTILRKHMNWDDCDNLSCEKGNV